MLHSDSSVKYGVSRVRFDNYFDIHPAVEWTAFPNVESIQTAAFQEFCIIS